MIFYVVFGLLNLVLGGGLFILILSTTNWPPYLAWLLALSATTFVTYGLDKGLSKLKTARVPELILNLLAALGGFAGAWLGMLVFRHKSNARRHPIIWIVLILSTLGHAVLIYFWLIRTG
jgi:uncharacterized membrane protein YsdA (DUF1294 family)